MFYLKVHEETQSARLQHTMVEFAMKDLKRDQLPAGYQLL